MLYKIIPIKPGQPSPMLDHKYGEVAADDENGVFYIHETLIIFNGMNSIRKACLSYPKCTGLEE